jgi:hypothetical protein
MMRLLVALALCACAQPPAEFSAPQLQVGSRGRDFLISRHVDRNPQPNAASSNALYVNFDGVTLGFGTDDAPTDLSELTQGATVVVPPFALPANAKFTLQQGKDSITDRLRFFYKRFNVQVVTAPPSGNYTMIAVGGLNSILPGLSGAAGVSPLDCDNSNPNNVVYDFSANQPPDYGGLPGIAITAAHESGHSYGLEHTTNPADIMYSVATPNITIDNVFGASFTTGNYSSFNGAGEAGPRCPGRVDPLDNTALLNNAVGVNPNPGDTTLPTVSLTFPASPLVPTSFPIRINASDNNQVQRVEVFKNLELIAVLTTPPYQTTVNAADNESFYLTVEAIDGDANHASYTKPFLASAMTPKLCPNGTSDCASGSTCMMGSCRLPFGGACTSDQQCQSICRQPMGVSQKICTDNCNSARPCPTGYVCSPDRYCLAGMAPQPKAVGDACSAPEECASMRCQDTCVAPCDANTPCADGTTCMDVGGGQGCVVSTMMTPKPASGGCSVSATATPPAFLVLVLAGVAAAMGRSRRFARPRHDP